MPQAATDLQATDSRYTIISADCHAGGSHQQYREYLDPEYRDDFDAWRGRYKNPFRDLQDGGRIRNWDDDRRNRDLEGEGLVAEVVFPNTVPPFFPSFVLFAGSPKPDEYEHRSAGSLLPNVAPDVKWVKPLYDPEYDIATPFDGLPDPPNEALLKGVDV